jgi:hypothetical protein
MQDFRKIGLVDADQFGRRGLREIPVFDESSELDHDRGFQQHIVRIGQA